MQRRLKLILVAAMFGGFLLTAYAQQPGKQESSFTPVIEEPFAVVLARDKANKPAVMAKQMALLNERYDLSRRVDQNVTMTRGKPIPVGPAAKLPPGMTWEK